MAQNAYEQYMLELVNRARLDPAAEAALYGVALGSIAVTTKQPLAANDLLLAAADAHGQWMLNTDTFSHTGAGGSGPGDRMAAAGYAFTGNWTWGENIAWQGTTGTLNLVSAIDAAHAALFRSDGHRANLLNDAFQELGMSVETGQMTSNGKNYNAAMVTEDFAKSGSGAFLTGVAYTDTNGNDFYSVGEGRGGVQIAAQLVGGTTTTVTTDAPGGYDSKLAAGTYNVTFSGGGLGAALGMTVTLANRNIKLDLLGTTAVMCSASLIMGANLIGLTLLGTEALSGTGNALANVIEGNKGSNQLDGGAGADTLAGGGGNDVLTLKTGQVNGDVIGDFTGNGSAAGDSIKFDGFSAGATLTNTSGNQWQIVDGSRIETFTINGALNAADYSFVNVGAAPPPDPATSDTLVGTAAAETMNGGGGNDQLSGLAGNDTLNGGDGNDTLDGGTGADNMAGGPGNDSYLTDSASDSIIEGAGAGTDTVQSSLAYVLGANLENLTLLGSASINGTGNDGANRLVGNTGANVLDGKAGADTLEGGKGNDTYVVDAGGDVVIEAADGGSDTVKTSITYTLADPNVEKLTLLAGAGAIAGTGNGLANVITGNESGNRLDGGTGVDSLAGGLGNDIYVVDVAGDVVTEAASAGTDVVQSAAASYTLATSVEQLTLLAGAGAGTGNSVANLITGNAADNKLDGKSGADTLVGGAGADTLIGDAGSDSLVGGSGHDRYNVRTATDIVDESTGNAADVDTIESSISYNLTANGTTVKGDIENLTLMGTSAINGTGNALANLITGNGAANTLTGNAGNDTLVGGAGNDTLVGGSGDDRIDVAAGNDTVRYTALVDGSDVIDGFDGNASGGQDLLNLDALFDSLGVAAAGRAARVSTDIHATSVDVRLDGDGNGSFERIIATLNTVDAITVGADIVVGT